MFGYIKTRIINNISVLSAEKCAITATKISKDKNVKQPFQRWCESFFVFSDDVFLEQGLATSVRECQCPAEIISNPERKTSLVCSIPEDLD